MAGRPILREAIRRVEALGGEQWVLDNVMNGVSFAQLAKLADVSRGMLYEWMHKDEKRWEAYQKARELGAYALAEDALNLVDTATPDNISVNRERANMRKWLAERANRQAFGQPRDQVPLSLNIGQLHLTAIQETEEPRARLAAPVEDAEFEVVKEPTLEDLL